MCSVRVDLEEITGEMLPELSRLKFSRKISANIFASLQVEGKFSGPLIRTRVPVKAKLRVLFATGGGGRVPCFISIRKFDVFKSACPKTRHICSVDTKEKRFFDKHAKGKAEVISTRYFR